MGRGWFRWCLLPTLTILVLSTMGILHLQIGQVHPMTEEAPLLSVEEAKEEGAINQVPSSTVAPNTTEHSGMVSATGTDPALSTASRRRLTRGLFPCSGGRWSWPLAGVGCGEAVELLLDDIRLDPNKAACIKPEEIKIVRGCNSAVTLDYKPTRVRIFCSAGRLRKKSGPARLEFLNGTGSVLSGTSGEGCDSDGGGSAVGIISLAGTGGGTVCKDPRNG